MQRKRMRQSEMFNERIFQPIWLNAFQYSIVQQDTDIRVRDLQMSKRVTRPRFKQDLPLIGHQSCSHLHSGVRPSCAEHLTSEIQLQQTRVDRGCTKFKALDLFAINPSLFSVFLFSIGLFPSYFFTFQGCIQKVFYFGGFVFLSLLKDHHW